jgi:hypothetical protein
MRLMKWFSLAVVIVAGMALSGLSASPAFAASTSLIGTFSITPGSCSGGTASGTFLRMVLPGGTNSGPYFSNSDSSCSDATYTPLSPGNDRGLVTGTYEPEPSPAFDSSGNALSGEITAPVAFEGVKFATATNPVDPQTGLHVPVPTIEANGTSLSGNLEAFGVSWNKQQFNQGSPKPGGSSPGNTTPVTGTYNPATGAYTLQWSSQVVGGPFNNFSAFWNLTGTFTPSSGATSSAPSGATSSGSSGVTSKPVVSHSSSAPLSSSAPASGSTTTTAAPGTSSSQPTAKTKTITKAHIVESSRTISTTKGGWNTPNWVLALLAVLAGLGVAGLVWSEMTRREQKGARA